MRLLPAWATGYRREWLRPDLIAGLVVTSVVVPQAVAYAQIAGLPPQSGLMAAPGALIGYALLGTSRQLVVSATTATSALSAAAVAPLAGSDSNKFLELSAALAIITAIVLAAGGLLKVGVISDFVSKPVITGFLFGLGLTITLDQIPALIGVKGGEGNFFPRLDDLLGQLDEIDLTTTLVGVGSIAILLVLRRVAPAIPAVLVVLVASILVSAIFSLSDHGVDVVGHIPSAYPHPAIPDVSWHEIAGLLGAAFGVLLVSTEAVGVARAMAVEHEYRVDTNRDLVALGGANLVAGFTSGFVQSGGASQTAAADRAGGKSQFASVVAGVLVLLTGLFLSPLFTDLPQAALAAIVVVAIAGFFKVGELARFARIRLSAILLSSAALVGVLLLGVLPGLIVAAVVSLIALIKRLSRPGFVALARDPDSGVWGQAEQHPDWETPAGAVVVRSEGPLFYANAVAWQEGVKALAEAASANVVVADLSSNSDLDVETLDGIADLDRALTRAGRELRLAGVRVGARTMLERAELIPRLPNTVQIDEALALAPRSETGRAGTP